MAASKSYLRAYYAAHKEECKQQMKDWYDCNKDLKGESNRVYYQENRNQLIARQAAYHKENRVEILKRQKIMRNQKRSKINEVALYYKCRNPDCKWRGEFHAAQLQFHHFDPRTKQFQLGKGADYGWKAIAKEINKCIVLCGCCHALYHVGLVQLDENLLCCVDDDLNILTESLKTCQ
jgi:hypothetical protein